MTLIETLDNLTQSLKEIKKDEPFTLTIQSNYSDPYKLPSGVGWRKAISLEKEIAMKEMPTVSVV